MREVLDQIGPPDVVIDDGSHLSKHVIASFQILFPMLAPGGLYVIEELNAGYLARFGGGPPGTAGTSPEFVKSLVDAVNHQHAGASHDRGIASVHLYPEIAFVEKQT